MERCIPITEPEMNGGDLKGRRWTDCSLQAPQDLPGAFLASGACVTVTEKARCDDGRLNFGERAGRLAEHVLQQVGFAQKAERKRVAGIEAQSRVAS